MTTYTISQLSSEFGVTLRTLRFYEFRKLLNPARKGTERIYSEDDREALIKIIRWRKQGFTLTEIRAALESGGFPVGKVADQIAHLRQKRDKIDQAIAELMQVAA